ncbi:putative FKBP-type peptidyl-prolyl cis-trans isomerase [Rosistilla oblonga]|nr:putative FKBP-type peptidyl-prolyl cis-trans isomerase [Rosistilla oblonga]
MNYQTTARQACRVPFCLTAALMILTCVACAGPSSGPGPRDPDAPTDFTKTESGLRYRILRAGDGAKPVTTDEVTVHYRGWLDDQTIFDSSYKRGAPATFRLDQVVPGWTEGLQLVDEGGMIELTIPSHLGYGEAGAGGTIPGGATLHFIVELIKIN